MSGRIELHRVDLGRRQTRLVGCLAGRELGPVATRRAGGCCTRDRPWPARHPRYQALGRACSSACTPHGCTGRGGRFAWQPIPALIPAFCRAGAGFSETSRAPIASTGAGFRAVVGRCETHLGLLDHQQRERSVLSEAARSLRLTVGGGSETRRSGSRCARAGAVHRSSGWLAPTLATACR